MAAARVRCPSARLAERHHTGSSSRSRLPSGRKAQGRQDTGKKPREQRRGARVREGGSRNPRAGLLRSRAPEAQEKRKTRPHTRCHGHSAPHLPSHPRARTKRTPLAQIALLVPTPRRQQPGAPARSLRLPPPFGGKAGRWEASRGSTARTHKDSGNISARFPFLLPGSERFCK